MTDELAERLLSLLARERSAIRAGSLAELPEIGAEKDALTVELAKTNVSVANVRNIATALQTNARMLAAARNGVKTAVARLGALRAVREGLSLYTADGTRQTIARPPSELERKA